MKKGRVLIIIGCVLVAAGILLTAFNLYTDYRAGKAAANVLERVRSRIKEPVPYEGRTVSEDGLDIEYPDYKVDPNIELPVESEDGFNYIGVLAIPSLGIELPVFDEWNYANLKIAPCRFEGTPYKDKFIICAHNYDRHFGQIKNLRYGDEISFTDMDGNIFTYEVSEIEVLEPTAQEQMREGEWDMTLFTCTLGGASRVTVRCTRK